MFSAAEFPGPPRFQILDISQVPLAEVWRPIHQRLPYLTPSRPCPLPGFRVLLLTEFAYVVLCQIPFEIRVFIRLQCWSWNRPLNIPTPCSFRICAIEAIGRLVDPAQTRMIGPNFHIGIGPELGVEGYTLQDEARDPGVRKTPLPAVAMIRAMTTTGLIEHAQGPDGDPPI